MMRPHLVLLALALGVAACSDDTSTGTGPGKTTTYNQVQRLGNPLLSEVLLDKRSHPTHGSIGPDQDAALIGQELYGHLVLGSPTTIAGRDSAYVGILASVLAARLMLALDNAAANDPVYRRSYRTPVRRARRSRAHLHLAA